ncbi:replication factor C small subunit [Candidatus Woesearchaeota archaeon]|nr:replication factor C small subunit [Candidatus Woesearchaeota archaeon]
MKESTIWTEKYRPQTFNQVRGQVHVVGKLKAFVKEKNMPHVLFAGPAGVGKTTLSLVVAKQLFGDSWSDNFLELNASDERGIDVIRNKVKDFARTKALGDVPFKIIYLDECDALTKEAQQALRRTMENYTASCRFILSCNYSSKIIDPIQSRCAVFKFKPIEKEEIFKLIDVIAQQEDLTISNDAKQAIYEASHGDLRRVENILQSTATFDKTITEDAVFSIASLAKPKELEHVFDACAKKDFNIARKVLLNIMLQYGMSGLDIVIQLQKEIWNATGFNKHTKLDFVKACGETEFRMVEGSDEYIQLESLLANLILLVENE